jgi:hypothetical protein
MTNAIGTGTVNLSLNLPIDERAELGRAAMRAGFASVGAFVRSLYLKGAEAHDKELASQIKEVRRKYYGAAFLVLLCASLVSSWMSGDQLPMRRAQGQRVRVRRFEEVA